MKIFILLLVSALSLSLTPLSAYEAPTDDVLEQLLANPKLINEVLQGASGAEAAKVIARIIDKLEESSLGSAQRNYLVAYYTSRTLFLLADTEMNQFATDLLAAVPAHLAPIVLSGLSVGGGISDTFMAHLMEMAKDNATWTRAVQTPNITLTNPVYNLLVSNLRTAQSLPPPVINSLPPPPVTGGGQAPAQTVSPAQTFTPPPSQPPVSQPYAGQG